MILIFGGAYMGKQAYARKHLGIEKIVQCEAELPDFQTGCVAGLEQFSLACAQQGMDAAACLEAAAAQWKDCVLIVRDISCGVVPIDPVERAWREENGRMIRMLAAHAQQVIRIWYGLPQVLK